jgi:hypothetical protein
MIGAGFSINNFSGARFFKPLGCGAIRFDFRHD